MCLRSIPHLQLLRGLLAAGNQTRSCSLRAFGKPGCRNEACSLCHTCRLCHGTNPRIWVSLSLVVTTGGSEMRRRGGSEQPVKRRRANRPKARVIAAPSIADLQSQVGSLTRELKEANERQTASAEVLQVINSSPGDLTPVFETILEKAHSLCAVAHGTLLLYDGEKFRAVAVRGLPEAFVARLRHGFIPGPNLPHRRLLEGARFVQVTDWAEIDDPIARASLEAGVRTTLFIPLRREGALLGYIAASRAEVRSFTEKEIALLESFAAVRADQGGVEQARTTQQRASRIAATSDGYYPNPQCDFQLKSGYAARFRCDRR